MEDTKEASFWKIKFAKFWLIQNEQAAVEFLWDGKVHILRGFVLTALWLGGKHWRKVFDIFHSAASCLNPSFFSKNLLPIFYYYYYFANLAPVSPIKRIMMLLSEPEQFKIGGLRNIFVELGLFSNNFNWSYSIHRLKTDNLAACFFTRKMIDFDTFTKIH